MGRPRKYEEGYAATGKYKPKRIKVTDLLFDQIYTELDNDTKFTACHREIIDGQRYSYSDIGINFDNSAIWVCAESKERLDFAHQVAEHYGLEYKDTIDKYSDKKYICTIKVDDHTTYIEYLRSRSG